MVNTWTCRGTGSCGYQHDWFCHSYCWKCKKKYEAVVSKSKRPREQRTFDADAGSSELVKANQAAANWRRHVPLMQMTLNARSRTSARNKGWSSSRVKEPRILICKRNLKLKAKSVTRNGNMRKQCTRKCVRHSCLMFKTLCKRMAGEVAFGFAAIS